MKLRFASALILPLLGLGFNAEAQSRLLVSNATSPAFQIHANRMTGEDTLRVTLAGVSAADLRTILLLKPTRVVLDLPPRSNVRNRTLSEFQSALLSAVRIGAHEDKTRIVLDVQAEEDPTLKVGESNGSTIVILHFPVKTPAATAAPLAATGKDNPVATPAVITAISATPQSKPTISVTPAAATAIASPLATTTLPATQSPAPPASVIQSPAPLATAAPASEADTEPPAGPTVRLQKFEYEYSGDDKTPVIRIRLDSKSAFKLTKTADKLYSLSIPNAAFASTGLKLPQFPPHDFKGFTYLQGAAQGSGVEVIIGVERGARVTATAQDRDILIRAATR